MKIIIYRVAICGILLALFLSSILPVSIVKASSENDYVYAAGSTNQTVSKILKSDMSVVLNSADYGGIIYTLTGDTNYIYAGGATLQKVRKILKSNMTNVLDSASYGGNIYALVEDTNYIYAAGGTLNKVRKILKSDMTTVLDSADYGGIIYALAQDTNYIYAAGATLKKVRKILKSDMTTVLDSADYGGTIRALVEDANYVYAAGETLNKVRKILKSDMTTVLDSASYGGSIRALTEDTNYVYAAGDLHKVRKILKSNMSDVLDSADYGGDIYALSQDTNYIYAGGITLNKVRKILKSNMTTVLDSVDYGGTIRALSAIIGVPIITTQAASNIAKSTARLNALVTDDGGESCNVSFGYGTTSQTPANFTSYDVVTAWSTAIWDTSESPYYDATILNATTLYYYRVRIHNSIGDAIGDELTFTTSDVLHDISNFAGLPSATSISLNWIRGAGGTNTLVKYALDAFPVNTTNGTLVYFGNNFTYDHTGLTSGHTYFYSAWGESGGEYSLHAVHLALTTLASPTAGDTFDAPTTPTGWFQIPDPTALSGLEPFYTLINYVADDWGMTRGTFWLGGFLILCFLIGLALYIKFHAPALALVIVMMLMIAGVRFTILPSFMLFIVAIMAIGAWSLRPYQT